ncbi:hypothetical protein EYF80_036658 [Liparis tanakae]|uniref:Uncharacterized protein n=1 Tax=Liparis tanakae TaxID=230148 RepID=A0A4Z2GID3_9TELE|nr:hypothetical protein EYF80_036658 [Liparis tanakae]
MRQEVNAVTSSSETPSSSPEPPRAVAYDDIVDLIKRSHDSLREDLGTLGGPALRSADVHQTRFLGRDTETRSACRWETFSLSSFNSFLLDSISSPFSLSSLSRCSFSRSMIRSCTSRGRRRRRRHDHFAFLDVQHVFEVGDLSVLSALLLVQP